MRKHKNKIIAGVITAAVLAFVFWWGGNSYGLHGWNPQTVNTTVNETQSPIETISPESIEESKENISDVSVKETNESATEENKPQNTDGTPMSAAEKIVLAEKIAEDTQISSGNGDIIYSEENGMEISDSTGTDKYNTDPIPNGKPIPIEPENTVISDKQLTCTLSVRCDTILKNIAWLDKEKIELVPKDGVIYAEQTVTFYEGESVFNLLVREMKKNKIHMEFKNTPIYNSAYIEGIGNLYEFDCGELSGWMYKVNDWFPNYGCSRYQLKAGDKVEFVYTCDLGVDVGGSYSAKNGG